MCPGQVWEEDVLVEVGLFLELLVDAHVCKVLNIGGHLGQRLLGCVLLFDLGVYSSLPRRLVQFPL